MIVVRASLRRRKSAISLHGGRRDIFVSRHFDDRVLTDGDAAGIAARCLMLRLKMKTAQRCVEFDGRLRLSLIPIPKENR